MVRHSLSLGSDRWKAAAVAGLALVVSAVSAHAASYNITFDAGDAIGGLPVGATLTNQYAATTGATFSANAFTGTSTQPDGNGTWATNTNMSIVSSTGTDVGGLGTPALVSGNLLHAYSGWLGEDGDESFRISFATSVLTLSADFAGVADIADTKIYAYNGSTLLTTASFTSTTGQQTLTVSSLSALPITSVVITAGDYFDWVGVDNIRFTTAVPEPSTLAAMAAGGLGLATVIRRRRSAA